MKTENCGNSNCPRAAHAGTNTTRTSQGSYGFGFGKVGKVAHGVKGSVRAGKMEGLTLQIGAQT
jgi:hypothetical protein